MIVDKMVLRIKGRALEKKDLAFLDLLVNSNWERPIYLNNTSIAQLNIDMRSHVVQEGMAYRVLPIRNPAGIAVLHVHNNVLRETSPHSRCIPCSYFIQ